MDRLYAPSNSAEHPQHAIQLLLFVSSLGIDRKPKSAKDRFIDSSNRGLHSRKSINRIAERDEAPCCRPGLVGVCGTRWGERFLLCGPAATQQRRTAKLHPSTEAGSGAIRQPQERPQPGADQSWTGLHTSDVSQTAGSATRPALAAAAVLARLPFQNQGQARARPGADLELAQPLSRVGSDASRASPRRLLIR